MCGFLKGQIDHCCIHIPNVTAGVEYETNPLKQIGNEAQEEQRDLTTSWSGKICKGLGWNVSSWIESLIISLILYVLSDLVSLQHPEKRNTEKNILEPKNNEGTDRGQKSTPNNNLGFEEKH